MSGGSYDYLYAKMERGESDSFEEWVGILARDLRDLLANLAKVEVYEDGKRRKFTDQERIRAELAVGAAIGRVETAHELIGRVREIMKDLAGIAHDVEWRGSGDYSDDQVVEGCVEWMNKKLGIADK